MKLKTLGPEAEVNDVLAALDEAGAVIVRDVLDSKTVDQFNQEVMPFVDHRHGGRRLFWSSDEAHRCAGRSLGHLPRFDC